MTGLRATRVICCRMLTMLGSVRTTGSPSDDFKAIKGIRKLHHFTFSRDFPGIMRVRQSLKAEVEHSIFRSSVPTIQVSGLPPPQAKSGLSYDRSKYLYKEIRPLRTRRWLAKPTGAFRLNGQQATYHSSWVPCKKT
eukprot:scpid103641/ scgid21833/ 